MTPDTLCEDGCMGTDAVVGWGVFNASPDSHRQNITHQHMHILDTGRTLSWVVSRWLFVCAIISWCVIGNGVEFWRESLDLIVLKIA